MAKLADVAGKAAVNYATVSGNKEAALDPATIASFIDLISKVIDLIKSCRQNSSQAAQTVKNPGLFARLRLRNLVKDSMSRNDFRDHGEHIIAALQKTGKDTTSDDLKELLEE